MEATPCFHYVTDEKPSRVQTVGAATDVLDGSTLSDQRF